MKTANAKNRTILLILLLILVLVPFFTATAWTVGHVTDLTTASELSSYDFSKGAGRISRMLFSFYPGRLYTPADFQSGSLPSTDPHVADRKTVACATCRLVLHLKKGTVYGINADSATYAQKLWVDGQLLSDVGAVSETKTGFVPKTLNYTVYFTAGDAPTEIVIERSNYVHTYADFFELILGPQNLISQMVKLRLFRVALVLGAMVTAFFFFLIAYFCFIGQRELLYFAISIAFITVRSSFVAPKPVMVLFPDLNWYLGHKLECCSLIAAMLFLLLFYNRIFPHIVPGAIRLAGYLLAGFFLVWYAVLPSVLYTRLTNAAHYLIAAYAAFYLLCLIIGLLLHYRAISASGADWEKERLGNCLTLAGGIICLLYILIDTFRYRHGGDINLMQTGLLTLIYTVMLGMMLRIREMHYALTESSNREDVILQKNRELLELGRLRAGFMADVSHEMRTPLTVISSYAGLTKLQIENGKIGPDTTENLDLIQHEAVRLGTMTEQIKSSYAKRELNMQNDLYEVNTMLESAARFCRPICEKRGNLIQVDRYEADLMLCVSEDSIFQVLYNLISNANRHCHDSVIRLSAGRTGDRAVIRVTDHGTGMDVQTAGRAFERGFSGDNSTGFGLAICRSIIEDYEGSITLESSIGSGTEVTILLPLGRKKDVSYGHPTDSDRRR